MRVIYQNERDVTYDGQEVYLQMMKLKDAGFVPEARFMTETNPTDNEIVFSLSKDGENKVSRKVRNNREIPVIHKAGSKVREALEGCQQIILTILVDEEEKEGEESIKNCRVIIKGIKSTAAVKQEKLEKGKADRTLRTITFCAGSGISSEAMKEAGFEEVAAVEWNPKEGSQDKFASIYEVNHPESVMFNLPMEHVRAEDLPSADLWLATLDCVDYSRASNGTGKSLHTMHLFMHLMRLFWEKPKCERPVAVLIENVPEFEKFAGNSLELCFKEEGYSVTKAIINSLDYGSRTQRKRFFMLASAFEGFSFPEGLGVKKSPIIQDGTISVDELEWVTPEEHGTLRYFLERQKGKMSHNHVMTTFDITKDSHIGTITKSHHKIQPENWIKHPVKPDTYSYLKAEQVAALQGIPSRLYLGDSNKMRVESIGQGVCYTSFKEIAREAYVFLSNCVKRIISKDKDKDKAGIELAFEQLCLVL